jgi:enoyl-CoA hydratase
VQNRLLRSDRKNHVATLTLNRPEKKNSLSPELVDLLLQTLQELSSDDTIRTVVIRGEGDHAFCAGYDIGSLPTRQIDDPQEKLRKLDLVESLFKAIVDYPFPVIAMINGVALGAGCELAVCCDIRIGAEKIRIGMPPAKLGIVYPWSGLQRFIQVIGLKSAKEIFFTGHAYEGLRLKELGLVNYLIPADQLESFTYKMAEEIAANAPLSLKGTKRILNLLLQAPQFDKSNLNEAESITLESFLSQDLKEGQNAFLEKRKPEFQGK